MYVFRNNTIERFFPQSYRFSGYDDISVIPEDDSYLWFYQAPMGSDQGKIASEIDGFIQKFQIVLSQIPKDKTFVVLTMELLFDISPIEQDTIVRDSIAGYNATLYSAGKEHANIKIIDFADFTNQYSKKDLVDWKYYFISQMGINPRLSRPFSEWFEKKLSQIALKRKKCLILDLDNTLWEGVLGEDGKEGIKIGGDYPGKAFHFFQKALLNLSQSGIILTACSKNNEKDVLEAWKDNPFMILREDNFVAWRINWLDKVSNIKSLADELNIGLDSMVFIDDNPSERELVRQMLPEVSVPEFPAQPYDLPIFYKDLVDTYFKVYSVTEEDKAKIEQYRANALRSGSQRHFSNLEDFLRSLEMKLVIEKANDYNIPRIAQLTQKTNQFNLTTKRYKDTDIRYMADQGYRIWCISVTDRFGDSGICGCAIVKGSMIDSFLLSCRILGKGIEYAFIMSILQQLKNDGIEIIESCYIPTAKNQQTEDFYEHCGFQCTSEEDNGRKHYKINLLQSDLIIKNYFTIVMK